MTQVSFEKENMFQTWSVSHISAFYLHDILSWKERCFWGWNLAIIAVKVFDDPHLFCKTRNFPSPILVE